jgi:peptide/nickel transport system permease protein
VRDDLVRYFPNTVELVTLALLLAVTIGIPLGMLSAVYQDTWVDHVARVVSVSGVALPAFWLGLMLQLLIALHLGVLPLGGRLPLAATPPEPITHLLLVDALLRGQWTTFAQGLRHALLPVVTLAFPALASIMRVNRAEMIETLKADYIQSARAQGFSGFRIVTRYALRNAMIPTLAMIGLRYGWMLGGTVLVETVFDWPGIGLYAVNAAVSSDFQPIMGVTLLIGLNFMLANLLVDLAYGWLDPRIRRPSAA